MRWDDFRRSDNIEDRRDEGGGPAAGGGFGLPGAGGLGIGTVIVLGLIGWALGIDPRLLIGGAEVLTRPSQQAPYQNPSRTGGPHGPRTKGTPADQTGQFVAAMLGDNEDRWKEIFQKSNRRFEAPKLVLFNGRTRSSCGGQALAAMGPFYCPADKKIYLDTSFFDLLSRRFGACADNKACQFAEAYVIAHEFGHHVQNLLGILPKAQQLQRSMGKPEANHLQVEVELQADCLAGVWANRAQQRLKFLDPGDVETALRTASAIGDDTLQKRGQGYVVPDAFTHGTSQQRMRWFKTGLEKGTVESCNTFSAAQL